MARITVAAAGSLWLLALVRILWPRPELSALVAILLVAFVSLALIRAGRHTRVLCGALGVATLIMAGTYDSWAAIPDGLARAVIFPAFLSTIILLRATADQRPEIIATRRLFGAVDHARRDSGIVIGTHILGSVLQVGVFAILSPLLGKDAPESDRRHVFVVAMRGMALVPLWSPFIVGMAVASQYLPRVPLWQIMSLGLSMAACGLLISFLFFDKGRDVTGLWRVLVSLAPVAPSVLVAAATIIATTMLTGLSTLDAVVVALPALCIAGVLGRIGGITAVIRNTIGGLGRIGPEASILAFAMTLGTVLDSALPRTGLPEWLTEQDFSPLIVIFVVIMSLNVTGFLGIHPVVSGTVLLILFTSIPLDVSDLVLMQALLTGWGLCTAISISSLSVATGSVLFRLRPTQLIALTNIGYVFATSTVIGLALAGLNALMQL